MGRIARVFLRHPDREMTALGVCSAAGVPIGTAYPYLARLERAGLITARWEVIAAEDVRGPHAPRRRYYRLDRDNHDAVMAMKVMLGLVRVIDPSETGDATRPDR